MFDSIANCNQNYLKVKYFYFTTIQCISDILYYKIYLLKNKQKCKQILETKFDKNIVLWQRFLIIIYNKITIKANN